MKVIKRDGSKQDFSSDKIKAVITKAFNSVQQEVPDKFLEQLMGSFDKIKKDEMDVEDIQDIIQNELIKRNKYEVVESFILYRNKRAEIREQKSDLIKNIKNKLQGSNIENQNANVDEESFGGRIGEAARIVSKNDALKYRMSKKSRKNHENNEIYIHDLDSYTAGMHNCLSVPVDKLLNEGFQTQQTDVRGSGSISTAMQLVAVLFQLQSLQQFGGVSATHIDWSMVPFVRMSFYKHYKDALKFIINFNGVFHIQSPKDKSIEDVFYKEHPKAYEYAMEMTKREVYQAVEACFHNLNTLQSRSGCQLPFSSINYGTCTLPEGQLVIRAILDKSIEGTGKYGKTSIFPCGIFQYKKGINDRPGTPNYELFKLALRSTAQRLYPNYANCDWSNQIDWVKKDRKDKQEYIDSLPQEDYDKLLEIIGEHPEIGEFLDLTLCSKSLKIVSKIHPYEDFSTMGCRTVNGFDINFLDCYKENVQCALEGKPFKYPDLMSAAQKDGRGNICPVTIILPTLAMEAKELSKKTGDDIVECFMDILNKKIYESKDMLLERFDHISSQSPKAAKFMYDNGTMAGYNESEGIVSALKHGTLTIGQLGVSETLYILIGKDQTTPEGMELAKSIEQLFLDRCNEFKKDYHMNFGVYYTPAENLCKTAMDKFKKKYGEIPNVSDKKYFTNSMHVPVWKEVNPYQKINIESQLTGYSNAGCITYVELPSTAINNIEALEDIVRYAMDEDIPYFALNSPCDTCQECHYQGDIGPTCPKCGSSDILRLKRVTGYLTTDYRRFNEGKIQEVEDRVCHIKN